MTYIEDMAGPIEVWLTQKNMIVTCSVYGEDESAHNLEVDSLSMRGAQREITGYLIGEGYTPDGRWTVEDEDGGETSRRFKPPAAPLEELIAHIRFQAHQDRDWKGGGWDVIEDTWTDEMIAEQIKGAKTKLGAQSKMSKPVEAYRAEKKAARAAAKEKAEQVEGRSDEQAEVKSETEENVE